jgi:hypothetical protein
LWKRCWLCQKPINGKATVAQLAGQPSETGTLLAVAAKVVSGGLAVAFLFLIGSLIAEGLAGVAFVLLLIMLPPGLVTLIKAVSGTKEGKPLSIAQKAGTFLISFGVTVAGLAAVSVAIGIAVSVACWAICAMR